MKGKQRRRWEVKGSVVKRTASRTLEIGYLEKRQNLLCDYIVCVSVLEIETDTERAMCV